MVYSMPMVYSMAMVVRWFNMFFLRAKPTEKVAEKVFLLCMGRSQPGGALDDFVLHHTC